MTGGREEQSGVCHRQTNIVISSQAETYTAQESIKKLKFELAAQAEVQAVSHLSSNDLLMGLAWLLSNEATGKPHPGQGPNGTVSTAVIGVDLARNGLPKELLPDGVLSNLSAVSNSSLFSNPQNPCGLILSAFARNYSHIIPRHVPASLFRMSA